MKIRKICFVATESEEAAYYESKFGRFNVEFCDMLADVPVDTEILSIFIHEKIDRTFLGGHPKLKLIATRSTGFDHIDDQACQAAGVEVRNVSGYGEHTVAEHTFALMLSLTRRLRESTEAALAGRVSHEKLRGIDLRGRMLGVVGAGRVGLNVIRLATAFGMSVLAHDSRPNPLFTELVDFKYTSLDNLLRNSDIITLHVPLSEETFHMINRSALATCKKGLLLINTARGSLIDTEALIEALDSGQVAGVGLDVLEEEKVFRGGATAQLGAQIADRVRGSGGVDRTMTAGRMREISRFISSSSLLRRPHVVFTPHNAYNSEEAREAISRVTAENIEKYLSKTRPRRKKNPPMTRENHKSSGGRSDGAAARRRVRRPRRKGMLSGNLRRCARCSSGLRTR